MAELEDVFWHDVSDAWLEHDAPHCRRLCDELHAMPVVVPLQRPELHDTQDERR